MASHRYAAAGAVSFAVILASAQGALPALAGTGAGAHHGGHCSAGAAVASAAVTGAAGAVARVASAGNGGGDSSGSVAVTPLSATAAVQPVPSQ